MSKLFVSTMRDTLYVLDTSEKSYMKLAAEIDLPLGLCRFRDHFLVAGRGGKIHLLDSKLNYVQLLINDPDTQNMHDILVHEGIIYVVDSNTNRIILYDADTTMKMGSIDLFINTTEDIHHVNCLKYLNGSFYLSLFVFDEQALRNKPLCEIPSILDPMKVINQNTSSKYPTGAVIRFNPVTSKVEAIVANGLYQPHSLCMIKNELHFAESLHKRIWSSAGPILEIDYYARGLTADSKNIYIGGNLLRNVYFRGSNASIVIADMDYRIVDEIAFLPTDATEIYDIIVLED